MHTVRTHHVSLLRIAMRRAAVSVVLWILFIRCEQPSQEDLNIAAEHGKLDMLVILDSRMQSNFTINAALPANNGHLGIVRWLHLDHGVFTQYTMDAAAHHGYIDIVKWLHTNRNERCTPNAVDQAAREGHFNVVKWLLQNRDEGCTSYALQMAIIGNHFKIVKWLHENLPRQWDGNLIDIAASKGSLKMVMRLASRYPNRCAYHAMDNAAVGHNVDVFRWLSNHRSCTGFFRNEWKSGTCAMAPCQPR